MRSQVSVICVALLVAGVGCGRDLHDRQELTGTVILAGQPLEDGSIQFVAIDPGSPWRAGATIVDGNYRVPRDQGLPPGDYRVLISAPVDPEATALTPEQLFEKRKKEEGEKDTAKRKDAGKKDAGKKDAGKKDAAKKNPGKSTLPKDRVPAEFNSASQLKVEVRSGADNVFDFTIP
jgi:hypothetical protein